MCVGEGGVKERVHIREVEWGGQRILRPEGPM